MTVAMNTNERSSESVQNASTQLTETDRHFPAFSMIGDDACEKLFITIL